MRCMSSILSYLRYRIAAIAMWLVALASVYAVFALSDLPMASARYIALLITFAFFVLMAFGATGFFRRRALLRQLMQATEKMESELPQPGNGVERDYQALVKSLIAEQTAMKKAHDTAESDSLTYYTLWVHQIKTPIAAMRLVMQERGEGADPDGVLSQELFKIERYADLALRYAKLRQIADDLVIERVALNLAVRESVKKFGLLFVYQKLSVDIGPIARIVTSDKRWLMFILEQILSNAVKYTKTGGVTIQETDTGLTIADTGIGIRSEDLPRIFERGYTGYNGRLDARASGVGLFLAKRAADALHIGLSAASKPGEGTVMTLTIPGEWHDEEQYL